MEPRRHSDSFLGMDIYGAKENYAVARHIDYIKSLVERKKVVYIRFIKHLRSLQRWEFRIKMNNLHSMKHEIIDNIIIIALENVKQLQDQSFVLF